MQQLVSLKNGQPIETKPFNKTLLNNGFWVSQGQGLGFGLVSVKGLGNVWMHTGGMPGYQSLYLYSPKRGFSLSFIYSVQPKTPFVFMQLLESILKQSAF